MTTHIAAQLLRFAIQILLLLVIPLAFALAWVREAIGDLTCRDEPAVSAASEAQR